jgi:hypothetical protein
VYQDCIYFFRVFIHFFLKKDGNRYKDRYKDKDKMMNFDLNTNIDIPGVRALDFVELTPSGSINAGGILCPLLSTHDEGCGGSGAGSGGVVTDRELRRETLARGHFTNDVFAQWYFAGLSLLGLYILFVLLSKQREFSCAASAAAASATTFFRGNRRPHPRR